ncbi:MAG: hypothetical protein PHV59_00685 [Victivallales bacterium]|nr:hypothetical protein [Victivallales bacterium]
MLNNEFQKIIDTIVKTEKRYSREAYEFVNAAVNFTAVDSNISGHISAHELLEGISRFALKEYSVFYEDIFRSWGINNARDVGNIIYALISRNILKAAPEDSIEDFNIGFDLFALSHQADRFPAENNMKVPKID